MSVLHYIDIHILDATTKSWVWFVVMLAPTISIIIRLLIES